MAGEAESVPQVQRYERADGGRHCTNEFVPLHIFRSSSGSDYLLLPAETITQKNEGSGFTFAKNDAEAADIWHSRKVRFPLFPSVKPSPLTSQPLQIALWSAIEYRPGNKCWVTDVCVPLSRFPDLISETKVRIQFDILAPLRC